jgi:YD repeat-containing protein
MGRQIYAYGYHQDRLTTVTWPDGAVISYEHDAVTGRRTKMTDPDGNITLWLRQHGHEQGVGAMNRPRQTTKETDPDTGLWWFGARWYDPGMGGWISEGWERGTEDSEWFKYCIQKCIQGSSS